MSWAPPFYSGMVLNRSAQRRLIVVCEGPVGLMGGWAWPVFLVWFPEGRDTAQGSGSGCFHLY